MQRSRVCISRGCGEGGKIATRPVSLRNSSALIKAMSPWKENSKALWSARANLTRCPARSKSSIMYQGVLFWFHYEAMWEGYLTMPGHQAFRWKPCLLGCFATFKLLSWLFLINLGLNCFQFPFMCTFSAQVFKGVCGWAHVCNFPSHHCSERHFV